MFCPFCGSKIDDKTRFCPSCGADVASETEMDRPAPPAPAPTHAAPATATAAPATATAAHTSAPAHAAPTSLTSAQKREIGLAQAEQEGLGMGWYKFMIYFQLFAGGAIAILNGIFAVTVLSSASASYGSSIYSVVSVVVGIIYIAFGVLYIYCRMLMARFGKKAPSKLYMVYGINIALNTLSLIGSASSGSSPAAAASGLAATIALLAINVTYLKKRAHLFVND